MLRAVVLTLVISWSTFGQSFSISATPSSLDFSYQIGSNAPASKSLVISTSTPTQVNVTLEDSSCGWLSSDKGPNFTVNAPVNLSISAVWSSLSICALEPRTYYGSIEIRGSVSGYLSVQVSFAVTAPVITASPASMSFAYMARGSNPNSQTIAVSGAGNFSAKASSNGNWVSVAPLAGEAPASLTVSLNPGGLNPGTYTGTITVSGTNGAAGSTTIDVTLTVTVPVPIIARVLNAASFAPGPLSAGEIVAIFAPADGGNPIGPAAAAELTSDLIVNAKLPNTLGGVQVFFSGYPAPVYFASAGQVNAVVPYEIATTLSPTVWVKFLSQTSNALCTDGVGQCAGHIHRQRTG